MTRLVRAELLKWRTTRSFYGDVLGLSIVVAFSVSVAIATAGQSGTPGLDTSEGLRSVFAGAASGAFLLLILGILTTAGEYRHNTITTAFLITPRRGQLVAAKSIAMTIVGLAMAVAACGLTLAVALPWLSAKDIHVSLLSDDVALVLLGSAAVTVLFGLIGIGVGAIVRNQIAAIVGSLTWLLVVEQLVVHMLPAVGKWLPFGASGSLTGSLDAGRDLLPIGAAALLLVGYAIAFVAGGMRLTASRDVAA